MKRITLVLPTNKYKEQIMNYKKEFIENEDSLDGTAGLRNSDTFEEWYQGVCDNSQEATVGEGLVPATTYLGISIKDNRLIGMIDIRHRLNDYLLKYGGHIGYSVRKTERNKGYATEMLALALNECKNMGIDNVLITCFKENVASAKIMMKNGAILENEIPEGEKITQRYWINLME